MDLESRKTRICDLRQKYFDELLTTPDIYDKARNTAIYFNSTNFVLVHKVSLKYLTLEDSDQDRLR
jgi:hypothetical protein